MDMKIKRRALHRSRILEGQMKGLTKAIADEKYCVNLLIQSLSIRESLKSLNALLLENHLRTHAKHLLRDPKMEDKAISELIKVFTLSNK